MRPTFHLVPEAVWSAADPKRPYEAPSLASEGFIHCTDGASELIATANRHYRDDRRPFLALTVDLDAAGSPWTIEDERQIYPHIHGPIQREAIVAIARIERDPDGRFTGLGEGLPLP
jgi:uncharacterized protein (DUF952 family)